MKYIIFILLFLTLATSCFAFGWLKAQIIDLDKFGDAICVKYQGVVWEVRPVVSGEYLKLKLERVILK